MDEIVKLSGIVPQGMDLDMLGQIEQSHVVKIAKKDIGGMFVDVATGSGAAEEKAHAFKARAGKKMEAIRKYLDGNSAIPGGRTNDALFYILAKSVMEAVERHGLTEYPLSPPQEIMVAVGGKPINVVSLETGLAQAANIESTNTDTVLIELFRRFRPAGGHSVG